MKEKLKVKALLYKDRIINLLERTLFKPFQYFNSLIDDYSDAIGKLRSLAYGDDIPSHHRFKIPILDDYVKKLEEFKLEYSENKNDDSRN